MVEAGEQKHNEDSEEESITVSLDDVVKFAWTENDNIHTIRDMCYMLNINVYDFDGFVLQLKDINDGYRVIQEWSQLDDPIEWKDWNRDYDYLDFYLEYNPNRSDTYDEEEDSSHEEQKDSGDDSAVVDLANHMRRITMNSRNRESMRELALERESEERNRRRTDIENHIIQRLSDMRLSRKRKELSLQLRF